MGDSPALSSTSLSHSPSPASISPPPKDNENSNSSSADNMDNMEYGDLEMNLEFDCSCCVCKSIVQESGNSLMECNTCQNLYHQMCHDPPVSNEEAKDPRLIWNCKKCTSLKSGKSSSGSSTNSSSSSGASGSEMSSSAKKRLKFLKKQAAASTIVKKKTSK